MSVSVFSGPAKSVELYSSICIPVDLLLRVLLDGKYMGICM